MRARAAASHGCPELPLQPSVVWPVTRATFPAPAAMRIGVASTMSGVGRGAPTAAFVDSCTSRYWPGASEPLSSVSMAALAPKFAVAGRARVLERHPVERNRARAAVEDLDVVVGVRRAGVSAAAVDLADDEIGADRPGRLHQERRDENGKGGAHEQARSKRKSKH